MSVTSLPENVRNLFPKEQIAFSSSITADEKSVLQQGFRKHPHFDECGEMIDDVTKLDPELGKRLAEVLEGNKKRLEGLSPPAIKYAIELITMVTDTLCSLTMGTPVDEMEAKKVHADFLKLSELDKAGLQRNCPDITF